MCLRTWKVPNIMLFMTILVGFLEGAAEIDMELRGEGIQKV